jgi:hypothetical protein
MNEALENLLIISLSVAAIVAIAFGIAHTQSSDTKVEEQDMPPAIPLVLTNNINLSDVDTELLLSYHDDLMSYMEESNIDDTNYALTIDIILSAIRDEMLLRNLPDVAEYLRTDDTNLPFWIDYIESHQISTAEAEAILEMGRELE